MKHLSGYLLMVVCGLVFAYAVANAEYLTILNEIAQTEGMVKVYPGIGVIKCPGIENWLKLETDGLHVVPTNDDSCLEHKQAWNKVQEILEASRRPRKTP